MNLDVRLDALLTAETILWGIVDIPDFFFETVWVYHLLNNLLAFAIESPSHCCYVCFSILVDGYDGSYFENVYYMNVCINRVSKICRSVSVCLQSRMSIQ